MSLRSRCLVVGAALLIGGTRSLPGQPVTEIVVIGGNHALHLTKGFTPTELRALLRKIAPDALGIENFPEWQDAGIQFHPGLPEAAVAMNWAAATGTPVYGVKNGDNVQAWEFQARSIQRLRDSLTAQQRARTYQNGLRSQMSAQARMVFEHAESIQWTHTAAGVAQRARDRTQYRPAQQAQMRAWDDTIAMGILALVQERRPRRLAVLLGSDHYGPTRALLSGRPGLRVLSTEEFFPLSPSEVTEAWNPFDAVMVLGANLDHPVARAAPHVRDHGRTRSELDRILSVTPDSAPSLYYLGRWHMLFARWAPADSLFTRVRSGAPGADVTMPVAFEVRCPPLPTYHALATFALANVYDLKGDHGSAIPLYRELLRLPEADLRPRIDETTSFDLRSYLDSLIVAPYSGGQDEHGRLLDARRPLFWRAAPEPIRALVTRRGVRLQPPNDR